MFKYLENAKLKTKIAGTCVNHQAKVSHFNETCKLTVYYVNIHDFGVDGVRLSVVKQYRGGDYTAVGTPIRDARPYHECYFVMLLEAERIIAADIKSSESKAS